MGVFGFSTQRRLGKKGVRKVAQTACLKEGGVEMEKRGSGEGAGRPGGRAEVGFGVANGAIEAGLGPSRKRKVFSL